MDGEFVSCIEGNGILVKINVLIITNMGSTCNLVVVFVSYNIR
jgi:hypothetical protein